MGILMKSMVSGKLTLANVFYVNIQSLTIPREQSINVQCKDVVPILLEDSQCFDRPS